MIQKLKQLINQANSNYILEFEEAKMMNVKVDEYSRGVKFVYIEEYLQGKYKKENFQFHKSIQYQLYFCRFTELDNTATEREAIRNNIETEIVLPFIELIRGSGMIEKNADIPFYIPLPRFDAHEVSIMLQIEIKKPIC